MEYLSDDVRSEISAFLDLHDHIRFGIAERTYHLWYDEAWIRLYGKEYANYSTIEQSLYPQLVVDARHHKKMFIPYLYYSLRDTPDPAQRSPHSYEYIVPTLTPVQVLCIPVIYRSAMAAYHIWYWRTKKRHPFRVPQHEIVLQCHAEKSTGGRCKKTIRPRNYLAGYFHFATEEGSINKHVVLRDGRYYCSVHACSRYIEDGPLLTPPIFVG